MLKAPCFHLSERAKTPVIAENDHYAMKCALRGCGYIPEEQLQIVRKKTLQLSELYISEAVFREIENRVIQKALLGSILSLIMIIWSQFECCCHL